MPYYPLPLPSHVVEADNRARYPARYLERRASIRHLCGTINAFYDSGLPLFTQDAMRDLVPRTEEPGVQRLHAEKASLTFSLAGLGGKPIDVHPELGLRIKT